MMLAALASVALAVPAYAWDFSASGSASTSFNITSTVSKTGADAVPSGGVTSEMSSLKLASSNTDGDNTASFSYAADWDGNLDQTITVSGTKKAGGWTASANVSYNLDQPGCTRSGNESDAHAVGADNGTAGCAGQTGEDTGAIALTDGTMTITLGDASHLSSQNVSSGSVAGGSVSMDATGEDIGIGAFVGGFHGVSLGYKISDTMSVTVAYQKTGDHKDILGAADYADGESTGATSTYSTTGTGVGASLVAGPATIGVTVGSGSTADVTGTASNSTAVSVMGLGAKIDLGDINPFFSYGSNKVTASAAGSAATTGGMELGATYAMGSDSVVFYYGTLTEGAEGAETTTSGMELGYSTAVGPASLGLGYGSKSNADSGYAYSDIDVTLSMSF